MKELCEVLIFLRKVLWTYSQTFVNSQTFGCLWQVYNVNIVWFLENTKRLLTVISKLRVNLCLTLASSKCSFASNNGVVVGFWPLFVCTVVGDFKLAPKTIGQFVCCVQVSILQLWPWNKSAPALHVFVHSTVRSTLTVRLKAYRYECVFRSKKTLYRVCYVCGLYCFCTFCSTNTCFQSVA